MRLIGIGNDIIEIERIKKAISRDGFKERVFSKKEIEQIEKRGGKIESYAGRFAGKEAISKAMGTGIRDFNLNDIEILNNELGKPEVFLKENLVKGSWEIEISISHCKEYAIATAIIMEREL